MQQLRASAALVIEWLTICHRQGWLGGPVLNDRPEIVLSRTHAESYCSRLLAARHAHGLSGPEPEEIPAHQVEVADAYSGPGKMGAASAYGPEIVLDIDIDSGPAALAEPEEEPPVVSD